MAKKKKTKLGEKEVTKQVTEVEEVMPAQDGNAKSLVQVFWNFFSSMKMGVILLIIITLASIIGTLVMKENYESFYNNPLFLALLGLLCLNLLICSFNRWPAIRAALRGPRLDFSESIFRGLKYSFESRKSGSPAEVANQVEEVLKGKGYRVLKREEEGKHFLAADKGRIGTLGSFITHLAFIVIIVAMVFTFRGTGGFPNTYVEIPEGDKVSLADVPGVRITDPRDNVEIKLNKFRTVYSESGAIKNWESDISIILDGKEVKRGVVRSLEPLNYRGMKFYQSSYNIIVKGEAESNTGSKTPFAMSIPAARGASIQIPGTVTAVVPVAYDADAKAVKVEIYFNGQYTGTKSVKVKEPLRLEQGTIEIDDVQQYTGLSVKRDPNVFLVAVGTAFLSLGLLLSFLVHHRRIWAVVAPGKEGALLKLGGTTLKNKLGFEREFNSIKEELAETTAKAGRVR